MPVYGAEPTIGLRENDGRIVSAVNKIDYRIPDALRTEKVRLTHQNVSEKVHRLLKGHVRNLEVGEPTLFVYRHTAARQDPRGDL